MLVRRERVNRQLITEEFDTEIINQIRSSTTASCMLVPDVPWTRCGDMSVLTEMHSSQKIFK